MSLVGPRPLYPFYLPYYTEKESLRHSVRGELQVLLKSTAGLCFAGINGLRKILSMLKIYRF